MIDFKKLRSDRKKPKPIDPIEIFRRLPKPSGFNDLYTSQAEVLQGWFDHRNEKDTVLKLHTGGGKTIVGLLIAQSSLNESTGPVLYLAPTVQLVNQTLEKAQAHGIAAVPYISGKPLNDDFINGNAVMVATYQALFNGKSLFGILGKQPVSLSAVILDDAHTAFTVLRDQFTLEVERSKNPELYESLCGMFRKSFETADRLGTYDDVVGGRDLSILEVPYWDWSEKINAVREHLKTNASDFPFEWPLLRDNLGFCHALVSRSSFSITTILPIVDQFPSFAECPRRIYMSATIADDSEIIRTFGAKVEAIKNPLSSRSLAGISERMILIPDLMPWTLDIDNAKKLVPWTTKKQYGAIILTPSDKSAEKWEDVAVHPSNTSEVETIISRLQTGQTDQAAVFANRYDGIDLPGDACRLLIMVGLPTGTSAYELFRSSALFGGSTIARMLAQRIEQGIGRGARGSGDHCVVLLFGSDIAGWIARKSNFQFLTSATRAQIEIGSQVSAEIDDVKSLAATINRSFTRDIDWMEFYSESLADLVDEDAVDMTRVELAHAERKAFNLWHDGYHEKAIQKLEKIKEELSSDRQVLGWVEQMAARIAFTWDNLELSKNLQKSAFSHNRSLMRPAISPPYEPLRTVGSQAKRIAAMVSKFSPKRGSLSEYDDATANLNPESSANQFEQSLVRLAEFAGWIAERHDVQGQGPDVLWLLSSEDGFVIEAKSRKGGKNALTKEQHGQLLVAENWFKINYPHHNCTRISVHPNDIATKASSADGSYALTFEAIAELRAEVRSILVTVAESQVAESELPSIAEQALEESNINLEGMIAKYLKPFLLVK